jgi:DNA-binding NarL/FixJ family response regulator
LSLTIHWATPLDQAERRRLRCWLDRFPGLVERRPDAIVVRNGAPGPAHSFAALTMAVIGRDPLAYELVEAPEQAAARMGGLTRPALNDPSIEVLTPREREVAALIAGGAANRQIAAALVISPHTAERHVEHILAKLDCATRAEVAAWAVRQGLAPVRIGERDAA